MSTSKTQLYVVITAGPNALAQLGAAVDCGLPVAAALIRAGAAPLDASSAHPLVERAQKAGVAALIEGDAQLARALRADGVHLRWSPALAADYVEARDILGNRFMIGVAIAADAETARHDAMELAEAGADYIGFHVHDGTDDSANGAGRELVGWWAEIFEVPCVGFVDRADEIGFDVNPEFLGLAITPGMTPAAIAAELGLCMDRLCKRETIA